MVQSGAGKIWLQGLLQGSHTWAWWHLVWQDGTGKVLGRGQVVSRHGELLPLQSTLYFVSFPSFTPVPHLAISSPSDIPEFFPQNADWSQPIQEGCTAHLPLHSQLWGAENSPKWHCSSFNLLLTLLSTLMTPGFLQAGNLSLKSQHTWLSPGSGFSKHLLEHKISPPSVGQEL